MVKQLCLLCNKKMGIGVRSQQRHKAKYHPDLKRKAGRPVPFHEETKKERRKLQMAEAGKRFRAKNKSVPKEKLITIYKKEKWHIDMPYSAVSGLCRGCDLASAGIPWEVKYRSDGEEIKPHNPYCPH